MTIPENLRYTDTHEWLIQEPDGTFTVGITFHAQDMLGDVVFVQTPAPGRRVKKGEQVGVIESVKAAADIYAPLSGEVVAARGGDIPAVREMLDAGVNINTAVNLEANPKTAMIAAAAAGQLKSVEFLLSKGADIDLEEDEQADGDFTGKASPVQAAIKNGRRECADFLLKKGAKCSPALVAAYNGDLPAVEGILSQAPADVLLWKVMARTADTGGKGISCFLVPADAGGLTSDPPEQKMGLMSSTTTTMVFDNVQSRWRLQFGAKLKF